MIQMHYTYVYSYDRNIYLRYVESMINCKRDPIELAADREK